MQGGQSASLSHHITFLWSHGGNQQDKASDGSLDAKAADEAVQASNGEGIFFFLVASKYSLPPPHWGRMNEHHERFKRALE